MIIRLLFLVYVASAAKKYNYRGGVENAETTNTRLGLLGPSVLGVPAVPGSESSQLQGSEPFVPVPLEEGQTRICYCVSRTDCVPPDNTDGTGIIDIRIVNVPPSGINCQPNEVYCCVLEPGPAPATGCGANNPISIPGVTLAYGQAEFGEYPWVVILLGPNNEYRGAGALVDNQHVITAAHKVQDWSEGKFLRIRLGEWDAANNNEPYGKIEIDALWVRKHPDFNSGNLHNDIAVIKLQSAVQVSNHININTVCLPTQGYLATGGESLKKDKSRRKKKLRKCWVAGWGKDEFGRAGKYQAIMKEVEVTIVGADTCENQLRTTRLGNFFQLSRPSFICAGGVEGKDACTGDGGSPLVCKIGGRYTVLGLVAWGIGCALPNVPGVYVNVPNYLSWIQKQIQSP